MAALPRFVPLQEAARRMRVSVKETRAMISSGKIQGGVLPDGEMVVSESTIPTKQFPKKEDLPEYKKYAQLKGEKIWVSEAARKYKVPHGNLVRWSKAGVISVVGKDGNRTFLSEQDVAYCADVYRKYGSHGRRLFNIDGTPYKSGSLAG